MTIQLLQALTEGNDSIVVATAADLKEFALTILSEAKKQNEAPSSRTRNENQEQEQEEDTKGERFLSSEEVREVLGISKTTLWRYQQAGLLSPSKLGKGKRSRLRFERSAVLHLLNEIAPSIRDNQGKGKEP